MQDQKPRMLENEMYHLLRADKIDEFNVRRLKGEKCDLCGADLRGLDLRDCDLEGASLYGANISGTYFPDVLSAPEIRLSREFGIRMRYRKENKSEPEEQE